MMCLLRSTVFTDMYTSTKCLEKDSRKICLTPALSENGKHVAHAGGFKEAKVDTERLKKRIQKHYDVTLDQFLKVWYGAPNRAHS